MTHGPLLRASLLPCVLALCASACNDAVQREPSPYLGAAGSTPFVASAGTPAVPSTTGSVAPPAAGAAAAAGTGGDLGVAGASIAGSAGVDGTAGSAGEAGAAAGSGGAGSGAPDAGLPTAGSGPDPMPDAGDDPPVTIGEGGTVNATIIVGPGETFDGENKRYRAGSALGDGGQGEDQLPVFRVEDGGRLINVVLGAPAADGVHTYGDVTLENIVWEDVGEDALTIKESGTVVLDGGSADLAEDKIFQINAASTFRVSNFTARNAGKFIRQNGGTTFRVDVFIDECDISNMDEAIFRTDSSSSTVTMTNTRYSAIGEELFMGVSPGNITQSGNTPY